MRSLRQGFQRQSAMACHKRAARQRYHNAARAQRLRERDQRLAVWWSTHLRRMDERKRRLDQRAVRMRQISYPTLR